MPPEDTSEGLAGLSLFEIPKHRVASLSIDALADVNTYILFQ